MKIVRYRTKKASFNKESAVYYQMMKMNSFVYQTLRLMSTIARRVENP